MTVTTSEDPNVTEPLQIHDGGNVTATDTPPPDYLPENNGNGEPTINESSITVASFDPALYSTKCMFFPHGVYAIVPALFSMMAWFACLSKDGCDYARVTGPIVADITNQPAMPFIDLGFGYYRAPAFDAVSGEWVSNLTLPCREYNTDVVKTDGVWEFAKVTSFLSMIFGGGGSMYILFASCFVFRRSSWRWAAYEIVAAVVIQMLTFSWFATGVCHGNGGQDKCAMNYGARADIMACVLWAVSALCIFCKYPKVISKTTQASNSVQHPPTEVEMSNQSEEHREAAALNVPEII